MASQPPQEPPSPPTTTRPWSEFFDIHSLSLPVSLSDLTTRVAQNMAQYKPNYAHITLTIFFLSLFFRPLSLLLLFLTSLAWYFLFFSSIRPSPPQIFGFSVDDRAIAAVLGVVTVFALVYANVWVNLFVSLGVSAVIVLLHAVVRNPSDGGFYGGLLDAESGAYSEF